MSSRRASIFQRIFDNITINPFTDCWEWQGANSGTGKGGGYGRIKINNHTCAVHIVMYTHFRGYVPGNKHIDHLCNNRICCNPFHLEMVTPKQNQQRRVMRSKENAS